jgi:acetolactate synthase-1/2/3 large subunit
MTLTGGMVVSRALGRYGIRTVFAVAGASHTHLLDALDRDGLRIVSSRHESGCVSAADGYARLTGRLGVALIIADQGTPNAINGIATAFHACSPVLVLIARLPNSWTEAEYDNAKHPLVGSISKWSRTVPAAERLAEYIDVAAKRALSVRRGPVVLQIPQEYFAATLADTGAAAQPAPIVSRAAADPAAISEAAQLLRDAKRPPLIAGAGACQGGAGESLATLSRQFGIPIAGNGLGRGVVPEDSLHSFSWPLMQIVAKEADVVCVVGARLKQRLGYGLPPRFAPQAKFIQIDVEAEELSRNRRIDVPMAADAGLAAAQLLAALQACGSATDAQIHGAVLQRRGLWVLEALQERLSYLDALAATPLPNDAIHPLTLGRIIAEVVPEDSIFVGDGADIQNWMYGALRILEAPGFLDHYPMGAMGVGTPLAVGAAAAAREGAASGAKCRTVVLTTGDGSFGFYPAELHAAASAGLKLICVVSNDGAWGAELHGQLTAHGRSVNTELGFLRYDKVGEGFGCRGEHVERRAQLRPALERALAHDGPTVINGLIDRNAGATLKSDPRAQMILFDDLASKLRTQHVFLG